MAPGDVVAGHPMTRIDYLYLAARALFLGGVLVALWLAAKGGVG